MNLRKYRAEDRLKCIEIFNSNCPQFFDQQEFSYFVHWLDHQGDSKLPYKSPTYENALYDAYTVIETATDGVVGCGGFYITKENNEARLAWGMIHSNFHHQGFGTKLFEHRIAIIQKDWPQSAITLGTSQHTFAFYEKLGMRVNATTPSGYGPHLDKYDMHFVNQK